jgi:hypothetical protein
MSIGRDVVQRGFMLGLKKDHTKPYLLAQVRIIYSQVKELAGNKNSQGATN